MRTESLDDNAVWTLGDDVVARPASRTIFARGDFNVLTLGKVVVEGYGAPLRAKPDEPPERHAVVIQWPPVQDSEARKSLAQQLRDKAHALPHPRLAVR